MDLTVLPFLRPRVLTFLGGGRGCAGELTRPSTRHLLPKNFEKTALRKRGGIFTIKMRGGGIITEMTVHANNLVLVLSGWERPCTCTCKLYLVLVLSCKLDLVLVHANSISQAGRDLVLVHANFISYLYM